MVVPAVIRLHRLGNSAGAFHNRCEGFWLHLDTYCEDGRSGLNRADSYQEPALRVDVQHASVKTTSEKCDSFVVKRGDVIVGPPQLPSNIVESFATSW